MYFTAPKTYIQSNSQLAYNINLKKYYLYVINKNKKIENRKFGPYRNQYFETSYDRIFKPVLSLVPN